MRGHYDDLTDEQVDAARTMIALLVASDDTAEAATALAKGLVDDHGGAMPIEGLMIVVDALLQLIEGELGDPPRVVLDKLARFLAS